MFSPSIVETINRSESAHAVAEVVARQGAAYVYAVDPPDPRRARTDCLHWAHAIAGAKGFDPNGFVESIHDNRIVLTHPNGHRVRRYWASGSLEYRDLRRAYCGETKIASLAEAEGVCARFLSSHGLRPDNGDDGIVPHDLSVLRSQGTHVTGRRTRIIACNAILRYRRETDGLAWVGPGAYLNCIVEGRDVVGYDHVWRTIARDGARRWGLIGLDEALRGTPADRVHSLFSADCSTGEIGDVEVEFGYYAADKWTRQTFLAPVYRVTVPVRGQVGVRVVQILSATGDRRLESLLPYPDHRAVAADRRSDRNPTGSETVSA
jgi:hypothetical protein